MTDVDCEGVLRKLNRREFVRATTVGVAAAAMPATVLGQSSPRAGQGPTVLTTKGVKPVVIASANGNRFKNGYLERDWTGVGISPKFDFIIIHESGHEWFGNAVSASDISDMWIHEGWATYMECLFVEYMYGHADYLAYVNAEKNKVRNIEPIITALAPAAMAFHSFAGHHLEDSSMNRAKWFERRRQRKRLASRTRLQLELLETRNLMSSSLGLTVDFQFA